MLDTIGIATLSVILWASGPSGGPTSFKTSSTATIEELLRVLRDPTLIQKDPELVLKAIRRLGALRAVEAIPELTDLLAFRYRYRWERQGGPRLVRPASVSRYPAREALVEIGKAALPALLEVVQTREFDSIQSRNARYAIRVIFRYDEPGTADEFLKEAAAKAPSPQATERLMKALQTAEEDMKLSKDDR